MSSIKVINLQRRPDRREEVLALFNKYNITNYEFVDAVDGNNMEVTQEIFNLFQHNDFGNRKGFIGCALSHYNLWKQLIEDDTVDYYHIMEDDIGFSDLYQNVSMKIDEIGKYVEMNLTTIDIIFLGYHLWKNDTDRRNMSSGNDNIIVPLNRQSYVGGTYSYFITKTGARKLLDHIKEYGIRHGIDYQMIHSPNMNIYNVQPHIVLSDWVTTPDSIIDSDIQKCYNGFDFSHFHSK